MAVGHPEMEGGVPERGRRMDVLREATRISSKSHWEICGGAGMGLDENDDEREGHGPEGVLVKLIWLGCLSFFDLQAVVLVPDRVQAPAGRRERWEVGSAWRFFECGQGWEEGDKGEGSAGGVGRWRDAPWLIRCAAPLAVDDKLVLMYPRHDLDHGRVGFGIGLPASFGRALCA